MSYINFDYTGDSLSGKTKVWAVRGVVHELGFITWKDTWRKYTFQPKANTVFDADWLLDIADFCEEKTKEHKRMVALPA